MSTATPEETISRSAMHQLFELLTHQNQYQKFIYECFVPEHYTTPESVTTRLFKRITEGSLAATNGLICLVWGPKGPEDEWYGTPLGQWVVVHHPDSMVPTEIAIQVLGFSHQRLHQLSNEGRIKKYRRGLCDRGDVVREWRKRIDSGGITKM